MTVDVEDALPGVRAGVEDEPELTVGQVPGDLVGQRHHPGEQGRVACGELGDVAVVLTATTVAGTVPATILQNRHSGSVRVGEFGCEEVITRG